jgi:ribonuclease T2
MRHGTLAGFVTGALLSLLLVAGPGTARAQAPAQPGQFDYYLLSLSWSPEYCASPGGARSPDQCTSSRRYGFVLHGLWPQHAAGGYPAACATAGADRVSRPLIDRMLPIMPAPALIRHEWDKHGTCTGLSVDAYFDQATRAYRSIQIPEAYRQPSADLPVAIDQLKAAFLTANPGLNDKDLTVVCKRQYLEEVRVCLSRTLNPQSCGPDVRDQCRGQNVVLRAVRSAQP